MKTRQQDQQRQFTVKFNQLVEAVASFAKRYNEGKGAVWPRQDADRLRKAMREVQQLEKALRSESGTAR